MFQCVGMTQCSKRDDAARRAGVVGMMLRITRGCDDAARRVGMTLRVTPA